MLKNGSIRYGSLTGYTAFVLQLPAYLTAYHTPGPHGRASAEGFDCPSSSLTFLPAAHHVLFTSPVKGAWRLALLLGSIPPFIDWRYYISLHFMRQPEFG